MTQDAVSTYFFHSLAALSVPDNNACGKVWGETLNCSLTDPPQS